MPKCQECGKVFGSKRAVRRHYRDKHPSELETPEEHLGGPESEQRDFHGEEPDDSDHSPEYLIESDSDDTRTERSSLTDFTDENDGDGS